MDWPAIANTWRLLSISTTWPLSGRHPNVRIDSRAFFEHLPHRPSLSLVAAHFHSQPFAVVREVATGLGERVLQLVGIPEQDAAAPAVGRLAQANHTSHADRFEQGIVEARAGPIRNAILADGYQATVLFALAAHVE